MANESVHYDVLIVGAGNAACAAALSALEKKVRVGLLEKAPQRDRGGNSALTGHMRFVFNGIDDLRPLVKHASEAELQALIDRLPRRTEADAWDEVMRVTSNQSDPELLLVHVSESRSTMQWLASKGQDWVPATGMQALGDNILSMNGERFVDEGEDTRGRTYAKMGRAILAQPGGVAFQILDAKARKMNLYPTNYAKATGAKADTLEKLAQELEINVENFVKTVREFNAAIQPGLFNPDRHRVDGKGTAGITPRKSNYALSVEEPPFEGWAVRCGMTFTFGGLKIDPKTAQVQHVAGRPIPGLYTAGEMVGGLWVGNYASGSGMMAGATYGRIAGMNAALAAKA